MDNNFVQEQNQGFKNIHLDLFGEKTEKEFSTLPTNPATNSIMEILDAGEDIAELPARKKQINHTEEITVNARGDSRQIITKTKKSSVTIELADIKKITGNNKSTKKMFILSLIKANQQAIHNGELTRDYISFPLQELVDLGLYGSIRTARRGFYEAMDALTDIKLNGDIKQTEKKKVSVIGLHPFRKAIIDKNECIIQLESDFNWTFLVQYFTVLPPYYFKLSSRASDLLYYIFYLARQNAYKIEQQGYFTISFRAIQHKLHLPSETGNTRPKQTIKDPIENAIEEIEETHSRIYNNTEFSLYPVYDDTAPIKEFLDNGYLKITLSGDFSKSFIELSKKTAKQIEQKKKRDERIMEKAIAIKTAAALPEQTKGSEDNEQN